ncbi:MAG: hypothetical protein JWM10_4527 [Myxococcaceae bacterium]|nr:hypothetical protein [Myxococcaceae bacterium]
MRELMGDVGRAVGLGALLVAVAIFLQGPGLKFIYFAF